MGSVGNQNPWAPYDTTYKDCSQGICSIYCPQWCYIIFPPPPPFTLGDDDSGTDFSPLIIAVIGILASAFILISYYTIISKYCRRRGSHGENSTELDENNRDQISNEAWQSNNGGLDESLIKSITVCKYKKGDGFVESSDCSVCLSEFQENESLRLLPKCNHAFHLPCIDTWLKSHASCPLCRAHIVSTNILPPPPPPIQETPPPPLGQSTGLTTLEYQHRINDAVLIIQDLQGGVRQESAVSLVLADGGNIPKPEIQNLELSAQNTEQETQNILEIRDDANTLIQPIRRSVSLNSSFFCHNQVSIADILSINEDYDDDDDGGDGGGQMRNVEKNRIEILNLVRSPLAMKRSFSTGKFMFATFEKGRSSMIPN